MEQLLAAKQQELEDLNVTGAEDRLAIKQTELSVLVEMNNELKDRVHGAKLQEQVIKADIRDLRQQEARLSQGEETLKEKAKLQSELYADIDQHKRLIKHLTDSRAQYMQKVWDHILGLASKTLATSTQGGDPVSCVTR